VTSCGTLKTLYFFRWLPFGLVRTGSSGNYSYWPDGQSINQAYNCAARNNDPTNGFWGWSKLFALIDQILAKAQARQLAVDEFDLENEVNLYYFTVLGRLIVDNPPAPNPPVKVVDGVGQKMAAHGFSSRRVTPSVQMSKPTYTTAPDPGWSDCETIYGDSALIVLTSELLASFGGAKIGVPPYVYADHGLTCENVAAENQAGCGPRGSPGWEACVTSGMISLAATQAVPTVTDIHSSLCLLAANGKCHQSSSSDQVRNLATVLYNDVWAYLDFRNLESNLVMFGETNPTQMLPLVCDSLKGDWAQDNVTGYKSGQLWSMDKANVTMRPWNNARTCYTQPQQVGAPNGPYGP
jgi:hypothetical protein